MAETRKKGQLTSDSSNPRDQYLAADEPADDYETGAPECVRWLQQIGQHPSTPLLDVLIHAATHHPHQLRNRSIGQAQLIDYSRQHCPHTPSTNGMADPDQCETRKRGITEECLNLRGIPCLRTALRLCFGKRINDGLFLGVGKEAFAVSRGSSVREVR